MRELVEAACARGDDLRGPDGLLKMITATVLQAALEQEMTEHLGREKHDPTASGYSKVRNGTRPKAVLTDAAGEVAIDVSRHTGSTSPTASAGPVWLRTRRGR